MRAVLTAFQKQKSKLTRKGMINPRHLLERDITLPHPLYKMRQKSQPHLGLPDPASAAPNPAALPWQKHPGRCAPRQTAGEERLVRVGRIATGGPDFTRVLRESRCHINPLTNCIRTTTPRSAKPRLPRGKTSSRRKSSP